MERAVVSAASLEITACALGRRYPVARIRGIGIAAAAGTGCRATGRILIIGDEGIADQIVTCDIAPDEVGVRKDACVDDADYDAARTRSHVPCVRQVHATH